MCVVLGGDGAAGVSDRLVESFGYSLRTARVVQVFWEAREFTETRKKVVVVRKFRSLDLGVYIFSTCFVILSYQLPLIAVELSLRLGIFTLATADMLNIKSTL